MVIEHRTRFSAIAALCGVSVFVYPAIAWAQCPSPTASNNTTITATDQLLQQLRQRREQQATVSMFSAAGSPVVKVSTAPTATATATTTAAAPAARPRKTTTATARISRPRKATAATERVSKAPKERRFLTRSRKSTVRAAGTERYVEAAPISRPRARAAATEQYVTPGQYAASSYTDGGYSLKDAPPVTNEAPNGVWAAVYGAYENHSNLNPGQPNNPTRNQYTGGVVSGIDTYVNGGYGAPPVQLGVLGGYQSTRSTFTSPAANLNTLNGTQIDEGGFVGAYGSYLLDQFAADLLVKVDLFDHTTRPSTSCQTGPFSGTTSETNTNVASNLYYRFYSDGPFWIEPTVGFRYTHTSYGDLAPTLFIEDGDDWRVQGGIRIGTGGYANGYFWAASILGGVYDDVSISGYTTKTFPDSASAKVDQGKIRGICSLNGRIFDGQGSTFFGQVDVYGGQDVTGVTGKLGARWQW